MMEKSLVKRASATQSSNELETYKIWESLG